jgi:hypothetical protein
MNTSYVSFILFILLHPIARFEALVSFILRQEVAPHEGRIRLSHILSHHVTTSTDVHICASNGIQTHDPIARAVQIRERVREYGY